MSGAVEELRFTAEADGSVQRVVRLLPPGFDPRRACDLLLAFHGHGADRWQFVRDPRDECRAARDAAARHGLVLLSPDYRGNSWMGPLAEADTVQLIAGARRELRVRRVFLVGGSMGGTAALTFTALHPRLVDGVASLNGLADFTGYAPEAAGIGAAIAASFGGTEAERPEEYRRRSAAAHVAAFTMPLAIACGGRDALVPSASVRRLAAAVRRRGGRVRLLLRPAGGHATSYADSRRALAFILGAAAPVTGRPRSAVP